MATIPTLHTQRPSLRPYLLADAPNVQRFAGAREVADTTQNIPHPYLDGMAEVWISTHGLAFEKGDVLTLAITSADHPLIGTVSLRLEPGHRRAELGYWTGVPFWELGYATEAAAPTATCWRYMQRSNHQ